MAATTVNSTVYQNQVDAVSALSGVADRASGLNATGELLVLSASYTTTAIESGSTINIGTIPAGSIVIPCLSYVVHGAVGTSTTFDIGDSTDTDRYASALDVAAAGTTVCDINLTSEYTTLSTTNTIVATTGGATLDASIEVLFHIVYRVAR